MPPQRYSLLVATLISIFALAGPAASAQEYTTPTTPQYQTPDSGAAPDDDSGAPDDDEEGPANDNAPDEGAGAPGTEPSPGAAGTLPRTGSDEPPFLIVLGLVLLLSGVAVRRGFRPLGY